VLSAVVIALALAVGAPLPALGVAVLAMWQPLWLLAAAVVWAVLVRRRRRGGGAGPADEARFLQGLAAELDAGASLRAAVTAAAARAPALDFSRACRLAAAGLPAEKVGEALQAALPGNGRLAAAAFRLASGTGGRVAALFHTLAARAAEVGRLNRERRALTAQARASAWVVGGVPVALLVLLAVSGRLGSLLSNPAGAVVLAAGLVLEAAGVAVVWLMVRGAGT
jgi:Flp pilus assembly protein TadB